MADHNSGLMDHHPRKGKGRAAANWRRRLQIEKRSVASCQPPPPPRNTVRLTLAWSFVWVPWDASCPVELDFGNTPGYPNGLTCVACRSPFACCGRNTRSEAHAGGLSWWSHVLHHHRTACPIDETLPKPILSSRMMSSVGVSRTHPNCGQQRERLHSPARGTSGYQTVFVVLLGRGCNPMHDIPELNLLAVGLL